MSNVEELDMESLQVSIEIEYNSTSRFDEALSIMEHCRLVTGVKSLGTIEIEMPLQISSGESLLNPTSNDALATLPYQ